MALTDKACKNAKPADKDWKLPDEKGLFLLVKTSGFRSWRWKYRFGGKEKLLTFGGYPEVTLAQARQRRDEARALLATGVDPSEEKKRRKAEAAAPVLDSFEQIARAWHSDRSLTLAPKYAEEVLARLEDNAFRTLGKMPIRSITAPMVLDVIRKIESRGAREMAHRVRLHMSDVFVWAIASGLAEQDPAATIRKALKPTDAKLRPAMLKLPLARSVLEKSEAKEDVYWATRLASRLLALTVARPGVVRMAERSEFESLDGPEPLWRIPAAKMKLTRKRKRDASFEFVIPLSRQAVDVVKVALLASPSPRWLFPGVGDRRKPISESTISKHYRDAGLTGLHVPHGWRSSFSTIMNERAAVEDRERDRQIIDLMLAHIPEGVEAAYNRAAYMPRRRELAQIWADLLMEGLPDPLTLVPHLTEPPAREATHERAVIRRDRRQRQA